MAKNDWQNIQVDYSNGGDTLAIHCPTNMKDQFVNGISQGGDFKLADGRTLSVDYVPQGSSDLGSNPSSSTRT